MIGRGIKGSWQRALRGWLHSASRQPADLQQTGMIFDLVYRHKSEFVDAKKCHETARNPRMHYQLHHGTNIGKRVIDSIYKLVPALYLLIRADCHKYGKAPQSQWRD